MKTQMECYTANSVGDMGVYFSKRRSWADPEGMDRGSVNPPYETSEKYRVSKQYWFGSHEASNHKATKPVSNVGPSSALQQKAI